MNDNKNKPDLPHVSPEFQGAIPGLEIFKLSMLSKQFNKNVLKLFKMGTFFEMDSMRKLADTLQRFD